MAQNLFPVQRGLTWGIHRRRLPSTRVVSHVSGREVREQQYKYPLYEFDLSFSALSSETQNSAISQAMGLRSLQAIDAHHGNNSGAWAVFPFKYADASANPDDSHVSAQQIGVGDGVEKIFKCMRSVVPPDGQKPYIEPVGQIEQVGFDLYVDGTLKALGTDYDLTFPNKVTFVSAPADRTKISADYTFYYLCRYKDDELDIEQIYKSIHRVQTLTLRTVKYP